MKAYLNQCMQEIPENLIPIYLDARHTAVITVDMHQGHLSPSPDCPCPSPRGRAIIQPINHFTKSARQLGLPVIHVRSVMRKDGADERLYPSAWKLLSPFVNGPIPNLDQHALEGSQWTAFSVDVAPEDYIVSTKKRLSIFYSTELELLLRNLGIQRIVLVGCVTDCCVLCSAFEGANRDFRVIVPKDLTRGTEDLEETALRIIAGSLGLVVDSGDLLSHWQENSKREKETV